MLHNFILIIINYYMDSRDLRYSKIFFGTNHELKAQIYFKGSYALYILLVKFII